jgi:chemotaxis protein CheZ
MSEGQDVLDQLDQLVRRLGTMLSELGWDVALHQLADELPDARERLSYVGRMTEDAAMKVLNMVDAAQPVCQSASVDAHAVSERMAQLAQHPELGVGEARAALAEASAALKHQGDIVKGQASVLSDIMMAQDFQDLSGQVIKKVVNIITHTEQQLVQLLAQSDGKAAAKRLDLPKLEGPQVPDKAVAQEDVDDLLASMGF